ncbi:hypothetical protein C6H65_16090 [Photorhabdus luminescens]|nr:hypothetical protein C6H65_16090 [Photorhabdus luminescens]
MLSYTKQKVRNPIQIPPAIMIEYKVAFASQSTSQELKPLPSKFMILNQYIKTIFDKYFFLANNHKMAKGI